MRPDMYNKSAHVLLVSIRFDLKIKMKVTQNLIPTRRQNICFSFTYNVNNPICLFFQFHQTIKTYLSHRVWQFYFYVSKNWPEEEVCLHFPGCTLTPNNNIYESFGFFCPIDCLEDVELIKSEDVLFDWSMPMYLNYTPVNIMDRIEEFLKTLGHVEHIQGEVFVCNGSPDCLDLGELSLNEVVRLAISCAEMSY